MVHRTVSKVKIDQALIRDTHFFRDGFEIGNRIAVEPHRDWLFQILDIRILAPFHLRKVVMVSHCLCLQYSRSSSLSAFLAENSLTTLSLPRKQ
jgi:hypothetical protein